MYKYKNKYKNILFFLLFFKYICTIHTYNILCIFIMAFIWHNQQKKYKSNKKNITATTKKK